MTEETSMLFENETLYGGSTIPHPITRTALKLESTHSAIRSKGDVRKGEEESENWSGEMKDEGRVDVLLIVQIESLLSFSLADDLKIV